MRTAPTSAPRKGANAPSLGRPSAGRPPAWPTATTAQLPPIADTRARGSRAALEGEARAVFDQHFSRSGKWVPASGWPLRYTALQRYYEEAQAFFGLGPFGYDADDWAQTLGASGSGVLPLARERFRTKVFQLSPHTKFGAAWRAAFDKAANPVVYLHANAIDIEATADAGLITGVSVATLSGVRLRLVSRMFVLAAGGLENARLLLASRGAQPDRARQSP